VGTGSTEATRCGEEPLVGVAAAGMGFEAAGVADAATGVLAVGFG
jgi:hypothetical protein